MHVVFNLGNHGVCFADFLESCFLVAVALLDEQAVVFTLLLYFFSNVFELSLDWS
jgi:hypothetical protein